MINEELKELSKKPDSSKHENDTFEDALLGLLRDASGMVNCITKLKTSDDKKSCVRMAIIQAMYTIAWTQIVFDAIQKKYPLIGIINSREFQILLKTTTLAHNNLPRLHFGWITKFLSLLKFFGSSRNG